MRNKQRCFRSGTVEFVHRYLKPRRVAYALARFVNGRGWVVVTEDTSYSYRLAKKKALNWVFNTKKSEFRL